LTFFYQVFISNAFYTVPLHQQLQNFKFAHIWAEPCKYFRLIDWLNHCDLIFIACFGSIYIIYTKGYIGGIFHSWFKGAFNVIFGILKTIVIENYKVFYCGFSTHATKRKKLTVFTSSQVNLKSDQGLNYKIHTAVNKVFLLQSFTLNYVVSLFNAVYSRSINC